MHSLQRRFCSQSQAALCAGTISLYWLIKTKAGFYGETLESAYRKALAKARTKKASGNTDNDEKNVVTNKPDETDSDNTPKGEIDSKEENVDMPVSARVEDGFNFKEGYDDVEVHRTQNLTKF